ncbi:MAG: hypothetical protein LBT74_10950 [Acidobacteriota bacterium]|nr:hypothetical protein [Acidobacteriota bacterium]
MENTYLPEHNRRFARAASRSEDYHRRAPCKKELDRVFRLESVRMIGNDWVVRYDNRCFQIERQSRHAPARADVLVCEGRDGSIAIEYRGGSWTRRRFRCPSSRSRPRKNPQPKK